MEKFITLEKPNNTLPLDTASDNILSFIISSIKEDNISKQDFYKILPSIYSFCYHKKQEDGVTLGEIEFKEDDKYLDDSVSAFSFANEVHFCPNIAKNHSTIINVFDLIDSTFHEINHVSEFSNDSLRSNTHEFHDSHFGSVQEDAINTYLALCQRHIGQDDIFKCPNDFAYEDKRYEILEYMTKLYFFDQNETNARDFATTSIVELMDYSKNKEFCEEDKKLLDAFRIAHFNLHLVNKSNILNIKQRELSNITKKELDDYTEKLHNDLKDYIPLRREIGELPTISDNERKTQLIKMNLIKANKLINNAEMNIIGMLGISYDENLANEFAETLLSINEEFSETSPLAFTKLIETTPFSPSKEQFLRCAKNFKTNFNNNNELNNISEFKTPLTPFVHTFSTCYNPELLLRTYAVNNNDFLSDLLKYEDGLVPLNKELVEKVRTDYMNDLINADTFEQYSTSLEENNQSSTNLDNISQSSTITENIEHEETVLDTNPIDFENSLESKS